MDLIADIVNGRTQVTADEVETLSQMIHDRYRNEPNVITIPDMNVLYVGDLHGDLSAAKSVFKEFSRSDRYSLVFLGDYADRGPCQTETVNYVFALALRYPRRVFLLRGNHESERVTRTYGFYHEVVRKYSRNIYNRYMNAFRALPIAGLSENGVFACHGGVPEHVHSLADLQIGNRYAINFEDPIIMQVVWNDPVESDVEFRENIRGAGIRTYGKRAFDRFMEDLDLTLMIRAHQVFPEGYKMFFDGKLLSIFSTKYNGRVTPKVARIGKNLIYETIPI